MKIISGTSNSKLAGLLAQNLGLELLKTDISSFQNNEKRVWIQEDVTGQEVILVQSFSNPVDSTIIEFLLLADALERMGAKRVYAVIPWMGYSLQDKVFRTGESIAAKVIANLVSSSFIHRVYLLDLHNSSIPGFFSVPTIHTSGSDLFSQYTTDHFNLSEIVVASPDFGGLKRARSFAEKLDVPLVNVDKQRDLHSGEVTASAVHGDVTGKKVILFDDIIMSGGTAVETAKLLKEQGAAETHFFATHGLFVGNALAKLNDSDLDSIVVTNSVDQNNLPEKTTQIDCSATLAQTLKKWL